MTSPNQSQTAAPSAQPLTPPAEPSNTANAPSQQQPATAPTTSSVTQPTQVPSTSLKDSGKSRRPRDVRLIHMLLASLGVTAYQERVPLQLLDFAYRYTSGVLQDAVHLATEGYAGVTGEPAGSAGRGPPEVNTVTLPALRLSIASRLHYQFQTGLPKEFLMDVAAERNRVALPGATRGFDQGQQAKPTANQSILMGGMRLPPERFCLTGVGWNMKDEWESEGEEEVEEPKESNHTGASGAGGEDGSEGEEDEDGKMEDIFGEDAVMRDGDEDGDKDMTDA
ncbi:transcription initiation factor IID, 31kD subunit-domain-containing protein [Aspergillus coremiiformis]|uniref:Transcription initiation factor IID, 31kD subunit-domain-containing protein n=1 Tax=Aspergillus coremiiformis TaxID=138285 RepID=A0A5N6Z7W4_9EURO|nr:transcription initiation factor IID, 31kD subunit-domain-containing protein [Aspergillus coremiiformis]